MGGVAELLQRPVLRSGAGVVAGGAASVACVGRVGGDAETCCAVVRLVTSAVASSTTLSKARQLVRFLDRLVHNAYKARPEGGLDAQNGADPNREPGLMTPVPRCFAPTDDRSRHHGPAGQANPAGTGRTPPGACVRALPGPSSAAGAPRGAVDATTPMDAKTAPTGAWKPQRARFPTAPAEDHEALMIPTTDTITRDRALRHRDRRRPGRVAGRGARTPAFPREAPAFALRILLLLALPAGVADAQIDGIAGVFLEVGPELLADTPSETSSRLQDIAETPGVATIRSRLVRVVFEQLAAVRARATAEGVAGGAGANVT